MAFEKVAEKTKWRRSWFISITVSLNVMLIASVALQIMTMYLLITHKTTSVTPEVFLLATPTCAMGYTACHQVAHRRALCSVSQLRKKPLHQLCIWLIRILVTLWLITIGINASMNPSLYKPSSSVGMQQGRLALSIIALIPCCLLFCFLHKTTGSFEASLLHVPDVQWAINRSKKHSQASQCATTVYRASFASTVQTATSISNSLSNNLSANSLFSYPPKPPHQRQLSGLGIVHASFPKPPAAAPAPTLPPLPSIPPLRILNSNNSLTAVPVQRPSESPVNTFQRIKSASSLKWPSIRKMSSPSTSSSLTSTPRQSSESSSRASTSTAMTRPSTSGTSRSSISTRSSRRKIPLHTMRTIYDDVEDDAQEPPANSAVGFGDGKPDIPQIPPLPERWAMVAEEARRRSSSSSALGRGWKHTGGSEGSGLSCHGSSHTATSSLRQATSFDSGDDCGDEAQQLTCKNNDERHDLHAPRSKRPANQGAFLTRPRKQLRSSKDKPARVPQIVTRSTTKASSKAASLVGKSESGSVLSIRPELKDKGDHSPAAIKEKKRERLSRYEVASGKENADPVG